MSSVENCLNIMTWNATGIVSSSSYLASVLSTETIDFCGLSEHWLYPNNTHFLDKIDNNYKSFAISDSDLYIPSGRKVGKGGVAILWHTRHSNKVTPLSIDDDRIVGIHFHVSTSMHLYIFQVYLPCSNHSIQYYREYIEKLENIISLYSGKGMVVIIGDINAHLKSSHFSKPIDVRGKRVSEFLDTNNLVSVNTLELCTGSRSSFVAPGGTGESLIDHIIMPVERIDTLVSCHIMDDTALNVSNHRPVLCCIAFPHFDNSENIELNHTNWKRVTPEQIQLYVVTLSNNVDLLTAQSMEIRHPEDIDVLYDILTRSLLDAANRSIPKRKFVRFLKPYWNNNIQEAHKYMKNLRMQWISDGRPRGDNYPSYVNYKEAKRSFRNLHRRQVDNYLTNINSEIDASAEFDRNYFWRLVNARRNKSCASPGVEMMFDNEITREPSTITEGWGQYFQKLYEPSNEAHYSTNFKSQINNDLLVIKRRLSSETECEFIPVTEDEITVTLNAAKLNKAAGMDNICYEHLKHGGKCVEVILCKMFNAMLKYGHAPKTMKRGIIITLFKGGRKPKHDPNNYRAITLGSVVLKLYERVLLNRMEEQLEPRLNQLQGGFRKNYGCLMTSFVLRERINFAKENGSRLYVCFLDVKKAFDCVWHNGLLVKLYQYGIRHYELKAVMDLYDGMMSCVKNRGSVSNWLPVLQGTRQGSVCSPFLYLVFIDELIRRLEASNVGFNMNGINISSPTVADDMVLISYSKYGLQKMMDTCFNYSCDWRYEYNASKCAVVVFNERELEFRRSDRTWHLGNDIVIEKTEYVHLGVVCDKYMCDEENVKQCNTKLRSTYLSLNNYGLGSSDLHPITSNKLYNLLAIPKATYGCELWNGLTNTQLLTIERGHRFCIKLMQGLSTQTRTDIALGVIGEKSLQTEIDRKKLVYFGQLCLLPNDCRIKDVFINRLIHYGTSPARKRGFVPDIYRLLAKYSLMHYAQNYVTEGEFMSKYAWQHLVNNEVDSLEELQWKGRLAADESLDAITYIHTELKPFAIWEFSKQFPNVLYPVPFSDGNMQVILLRKGTSQH
ncbi:MAG: reverse transcriptase family protein [Sedimenticola sp.]